MDEIKISLKFPTILTFFELNIEQTNLQFVEYLFH